MRHIRIIYFRWVVIWMKPRSDHFRVWLVNWIQQQYISTRRATQNWAEKSAAMLNYSYGLWAAWEARASRGGRAEAWILMWISGTPRSNSGCLQISRLLSVWIHPNTRIFKYFLLPQQTGKPAQQGLAWPRGWLPMVCQKMHPHLLRLMQLWQWNEPLKQSEVTLTPHLLEAILDPKALWSKMWWVREACQWLVYHSPKIPWNLYAVAWMASVSPRLLQDLVSLRLGEGLALESFLGPALLLNRLPQPPVSAAPVCCLQQLYKWEN